MEEKRGGEVVCSAAMPDFVNIQAPAKLNVALSVGSPDADGMHPIASWMVTVNLFDDLHVQRLVPGTLPRYAILWHAEAKRRSEIDWSITKDLAVRAHLALEKHCGRALPVQMKLEKRIPVGGGLGGGSSDAAAMLRALDELFNLGLTLDQLATIGATLGSDVPFLIRGGSAIVEGFGDRITPQEHIPQLNAIIVFPEASCPTGAVYRQFDLFGEAALKADAVAELARSRRIAADTPFNDLAEAAMRLAPTLKVDLGRVAEMAQRPAHISGSGSSLFVICDDDMHALALADAVERKLGLPSAQVKATRPSTHSR